MKCFIVVDDSENKIMKVQDEDIASFRSEYGGKILVEGDSVQEVLIKLSAELNGDRAGEFETALHR